MKISKLIRIMTYKFLNEELLEYLVTNKGNLHLIKFKRFFLKCLL
jgi:hypothetical protein